MTSARYTVAACYTGRTTGDGGRISVVAPCGKRHDYQFSHAGTAFEVPDALRPSTATGCKQLTQAILAALLVAQAAHFTGATTCGM